MMKTKIKVLGFVYQTETPIIHLLEVFTHMRGDYDIQLILPNTPKNEPKITKPPKEVKVHQVPFTQHKKVPGFSMLLYEIYIMIYLLISREKIGIIYNRERPLGFAPYIIHKFKKVPIITEVNGILLDEIPMVIRTPSFLNPVIMGLISYIENKIFSVSDKIVSVTPKIKNELKKMYQILDKKIVVIENGANTDLFKPMDKKKTREKLKLVETGNYITFVGNLAPWQGIESLVQASPLILEEIPDTKFLIVGDGLMKDDLLNMVEDLNLQEAFIFTGMVSYEKVPLYINASDICVAPFIRERNDDVGLSPLKIYEYVACEKAVVSSRILNLEFIEENWAGILVEPDNPGKLAKAIIRLLKNEKLRKEMGKNGRRHVIQHHSWKIVAKRIDNILRDLNSNVGD